MPIRGSALFCDSLRREEGGKILVVGGYSHVLCCSEFPLDANFDCLVRMSGIEAQSKKLELILNHIGYDRDSSDFDISENDGPNITLAILGVPIKAASAGEFVVQVSVDGSEPVEVERLLVSIEGE